MCSDHGNGSGISSSTRYRSISCGSRGVDINDNNGNNDNNSGSSGDTSVSNNLNNLQPEGLAKTLAKKSDQMLSYQITNVLSTS